MSKNIAIIGSGISGLSAAFHLHQLNPDVSITIFEKNNYFGGHTDTHEITLDDGSLSVDTGFIVFNDLSYPVFCEMLSTLKVPSQYSDMSFSVANCVSNLTYNPSKQWNLLARPQNFLRKGFVLMLKQIMRFYAEGRALSLEGMDPKLTLGEYLDQHNYSQMFKEEHIYPMCGALWSATPKQTEELPLKFVVGFFTNHRMLQIKDRPLWKTVTGGSNSYIKSLRKYLGKSTHWLNDSVSAVVRSDDYVNVISGSESHYFDEVIFACHADEALAILGEDASSNEIDVLKDFTFRSNEMVLHTDKKIMPESKSQWASWHVHVAKDPLDYDPEYSITYWMNRLQKLNTSSPVLATLNPHQHIDSENILKVRSYTHPTYTPESFNAQTKWRLVNGLNRTHFCGAYWGYGFHEDGAVSGLRAVCSVLGVSDVRLDRDVRLHKGTDDGE